jgi:hypothetical protein
VFAAAQQPQHARRILDRRGLLENVAIDYDHRVRTQHNFAIADQNRQGFVARKPLDIIDGGLPWAPLLAHIGHPHSKSIARRLEDLPPSRRLRRKHKPERH